jgi:hypothetical protein
MRRARAAARTRWRDFSSGRRSSRTRAQGEVRYLKGVAGGVRPVEEADTVDRRGPCPAGTACPRGHSALAGDERVARVAHHSLAPAPVGCIKTIPLQIMGFCSATEFLHPTGLTNIEASPRAIALTVRTEFGKPICAGLRRRASLRLRRLLRSGDRNRFSRRRAAPRWRRDKTIGCRWDDRRHGGRGCRRIPPREHRARARTRSPRTGAAYPLPTRVGRRRCSRGCCEFSGSSGTSEGGRNRPPNLRQRTAPEPALVVAEEPNGYTTPSVHKTLSRLGLGSAVCGALDEERNDCG